MNSPALPILHLDKSSASGGLHLERDGQRVSLEDAFANGFHVSAEDAPALLTLAERFIKSREEQRM